MDTVKDMNKAVADGMIKEDFKYSHSVLGERFYETHILATRESGIADRVPILVSERLIDVTKDWCGKAVEVTGSFKSYNRRFPDGGHKVFMHLFVRGLVELDSDKEVNVNKVSITGHVCKNTVYRRTPAGREICDILVSANRTFGRTDYIPCIAWGKNAAVASLFSVGQEISFIGRIQSRDYIKNLPGDTQETRTAYEVSISSMEVLADVKQEKG